MGKYGDTRDDDFDFNGPDPFQDDRHFRFARLMDATRVAYYHTYMTEQLVLSSNSIFTTSTT